MWSPRGARRACEVWDDNDPSVAGLYTVRGNDGGGLQRLTRNPYGGHDIPGDYSPDGAHIVFVRDNPTRADGQAAVFIVDQNGSAPRQVTPWGMARVSASWSPNGQWILFDAGGRLFVVRPDGSRLREIRLRTESGYFALEPSWSPDGTHMVFAMFLPSLPDNDIFTARPDGTDVLNVTHSPDQHEGQPDWGSRHP